jgi:hypothetical protein
MATDDKPKSFWSSLPGVLASIAALLTAIAGLIVALRTTNQPQITGGVVSAPVVTATTKDDSPVSPASAVAQPTTADYHRVLQSEERNGDTVKVLSITPSPEIPLVAGKDTPITVKVAYSLKSVKSALLYVQIAQFDKDLSSGCGGDGHVPDAGNIRIEAGQGEASIEVIWRGGVSKEMRPREGHIAPTFSIWSDNRQERISVFPTLQEACYRFSSAR